MNDAGCNSREELDDLVRQIREFVDERDWEQFHSPKNLAMALVVEAAELVEIFQWMTEENSSELNDRDRRRATEEIADVMNYITNSWGNKNDKMITSEEVSKIKK